MTLQVVTANRLRDGIIVWLTPQNTWSEDFAESTPLRDEAEAKAALEAAALDVKARLVVGPYLAEVEETDEGLQPLSARERIRASRRPTITPDQGSWTGRIAG
jgi:sulfite reductase (NADPH) hemoprotein beta-component